jgi:hypothetical protein
LRLYRVIPYDESVAPAQRGGALFVPAGGAHRIDNPDLYDVLYVAAEPEAAVAEAFGRIPVWTTETFVHGSGRAQQLLTYELLDTAMLFDLNDVVALAALGINRPTDVVTRNRARTQAWARAIFEQGGYAGARWWSYYEPEWTVVGLWERGGVAVVDQPEILSVDHAAVRNAAARIVRQIVRSSEGRK